MVLLVDSGRHLKSGARAAGVLACAIGLALGTTAGAESLSERTSNAACAPGWTQLTAASVPGVELGAVAAAAPDDAWAVGRRVIEHWDGSKWVVVPGASGVSAWLADVAADSASDAWVVGQTGGASSALIEHWDGSRWTTIYRSHAQEILSAVASVSADDAWAVGNEGEFGGDASVTLHWDGRRWQRIPSPGRAQLYDVVALSGDDVWAVGSRDDTSLFTMHWNGVRWRPYPGPSFAEAQFAWLRTVSAVSARDMWAAGEVQYGSTIHSGVVYRWDGARWRTVKGPGGEGVDSIDAVTAKDVWAVGYDNPFFGGDGGWIDHWDGARWQTTRLPRRHLLDAVAPDGAGGLWAVGATNEPLSYHEPIKPRPLIERYGC